VKQAHVVIGGIYVTRINNRLTRVVVESSAVRETRRGLVFTCHRVGRPELRPVKRSAAQLQTVEAYKLKTAALAIVATPSTSNPARDGMIAARVEEEVYEAIERELDDASEREVSFYEAVDLCLDGKLSADMLGNVSMTSSGAKLTIKSKRKR